MRLLRTRMLCHGSMMSDDVRPIRYFSICRRFAAPSDLLTMSDHLPLQPLATFYAAQCRLRRCALLGMALTPR